VKVLDLFSGIGGFSLGLERAGFTTVAFCEIEPYCRAVLKKHWPHVPCYEDVRTLTAERLAADGISVDVICGGFPCQDISNAGNCAGIEGERSGLWSEIARLAGELRPQYLIVENVSALLGRGFSRVLGDLAALGFNAEWHCIPASAVGAPHQRDRVWIVAYPNGSRCSQQSIFRQQSRRTETFGSSEIVADTIVKGLEGGTSHTGNDASQLPTAERSGEISHSAHNPANSNGIRRGDPAGQWWAEPDVGRVAHGVSSRVDRLKSLGNAVVPQIPEIIGRAILATQPPATFICKRDGFVNRECCAPCNCHGAV
jgi:DNA (cytosine-5)-methyltransferase 1